MGKRANTNLISIMKALIGVILMLYFAVLQVNLAYPATLSRYIELTDSSQINVEFVDGISSSMAVRAIKPADLKVTYTLSGTTYETTDYTLVDDIVAPLKGDYTITLKLKNITKTVIAAKNLSNSETFTEYVNALLETDVITINSIGVSNNEDMEVIINTDYTELVSLILTKDEIEDAILGTNISINLEITFDVDDSIRESKGGKAIEGLLTDTSKVMYFSVNLYKVYDNSSSIGNSSLRKVSITELDLPISFTINIPSDLLKSGRVFSLVASHTLTDGTIQTFKLDDYDDSDTTYTVNTDRFCAMALVYADSMEATDTTSSNTKYASNTDNIEASVVTTTAAITYNMPQTNDSNCKKIIIIIIGCMLAIGVGIGSVIKLIKC